MPHLTETDLARITTMPQDAQHIPLNAYLDSKPRATYRPVRECFSDIFNVQYPLLNTTLPQTKWPIIESKIRQSCWSQKLIKANLAVAKGLHDFVCAHDVVTRSQAFMPFSLGAIGSVVYWLPLILAYEGRALVPFIDPRRRMRLTPQGWRFVFSVMHERIRVSNPDYTNIQFAIIQFEDVDDDARRVELHLDEGVALFSNKELENMVSYTYELLGHIIESRTAERKKGSRS